MPCTASTTVLQVESTWPINILKLLGPGSLITQQGPKHTSQRRIMSQVGSCCLPDAGCMKSCLHSLLVCCCREIPACSEPCWCHEPACPGCRWCPACSAPHQPAASVVLPSSSSTPGPHRQQHPHPKECIRDNLQPAHHQSLGSCHFHCHATCLLPACYNPVSSSSNSYVCESGVLRASHSSIWTA